MPDPDYRILIVDDNAMIHDDFRKILCPRQKPSDLLGEMEATLFEAAPTNTPLTRFQLDSAKQGQQGLEMVEKSLAENRPYALAFVDVRMPPGWDGIETVKHLWECYPELQIVICTAYSDYSWEELRDKVGQPDSLVVLKKPFDNVEVQQLAHVLTKKWQLGLQAGLHVAGLETLLHQRTLDLEQANRNLAATEERFSKVFHSSPIPAAIQSLADRRFVEGNDRMVALIGCSRETLIGRPSDDLLVWEEPERVDRWFEHLARNEKVRDEFAKVRIPSGARLDMVVCLTPISWRGQPHALVHWQDLTEQSSSQQQFPIPPEPATDLLRRGGQPG